MAIKRVTIAGLVDVLQYDDTEYGHAIETTETINVGGVTAGTMPAITPVDSDLIVLRDVSNSNELSTCTIAQLRDLIKGFLDTLIRGAASIGVTQVSALTTEITMASSVSAVATQVSEFTVPDP